MDQNLTMQWTPYIITGDKRMLQQFKVFMKKILQGVQTIFTSKGFRTEDVNVLQTNAPFIADELHGMKQAILRECMTLLGIENANMDKKRGSFRMRSTQTINRLLRLVIFGLVNVKSD